MLRISDEEILDHLAIENPWWKSGVIDTDIAEKPRRSYFDHFHALVAQNDVRRSVILLGPRRVGKTVLIQQLIGKMLADGASKESMFFASLDRPLYNGISLEKLVRQHVDAHPLAEGARYFFFFDEIQYLRNWEGELKSLTDVYRSCSFVASGSAAAALRAKSNESGAGRFTTFLLPPLTFDEFISFQKDGSPQLERLNAFSERGFSGGEQLSRLDIEYSNILFEQYCSFGGYPEAVFSDRIQQNLSRYIREDIIDKVLLRDLPSIYGISDTRELNSLFTTLALNTAQEISLEGLSQNASLAKNTLKKYLDYLEAAFLIKRARRIDHNASHFQRETTFKTYLTNPSLRAALFRPLTQDDEHFGHLAETAVFSQLFHDVSSSRLHYARWNEGEIDIVELEAETQKPEWFAEVKWSDRHLGQRDFWQQVSRFSETHRKSLRSGTVTSRTVFETRMIGSMRIQIMPTSMYAWMVGRNLVNSLSDHYEAESTGEQFQLFEN